METHILVILIAFIELSSATSSDLLNRAKLKDYEKYFEDVIQETIYEVERREWSTMKVTDMHLTLNQQFYDWLVQGTVNYTNGFLVSIQSIELTNIEQSVGNNTALISGLLRFRDMAFGFDITTNMTGSGVQHYTAVLEYREVDFTIIIQNYHNDTTVPSFAIQRLSGDLTKQYTPENNLTQVLSRNYQASDLWDGIQSWGSNLFSPIMTELVMTRFPFPKVCFNYC